MQKKSIITIAGKPGSGKSTTSKLIAESLHYERFSSGDLFRALGNERGLDVLNTNLSAEENSEIDHLVDQRLRDIGKNENDRVIDSRTAWHWMPQSFKVFLELDLKTAAERILRHADPARARVENITDDVDSYADQLQQRLDSENRRYQNLYAIDPLDLTNYDLVIDTKQYSPEEAADAIIAAYKSWLQA